MLTVPADFTAILESCYAPASLWFVFETTFRESRNAHFVKAFYLVCASVSVTDQVTHPIQNIG
jgi:hypothetical protein